MTSAALNDFLESVASIETVVAGSQLVDLNEEQAKNQNVDLDSHNQALRFMRNGVAVALFASLEQFLWDRTQEVATVLSHSNIPKQSFPARFHDLVNKHSVEVLQRALNGPDPREITATVYEDLSRAWSHNGQGAWRIPHAALVWPGSNVTAYDFLRPLEALGVAEGWTDVSGVMTLVASQDPPTKSQFEELAKIRHSAAHDSKFDAQLLTLRNKPEKVREFAFCFDALLSVAAFQYRTAGACTKRGRNAIDLARFEWKETVVEQFNGAFTPTPQEPLGTLFNEDVSAAMNLEASKGKIALLLERDAADFAKLTRWVTPV